MIFESIFTAANSPWWISEGHKLPIDYCFLNSSRAYFYWNTSSSDRKKSFLFSCSSNGCGTCCFPGFVVSKLGENQKWMKQESSQNGLIDPNDPKDQNCLIDPNDPKGQLIQFSNAIIVGL